MKIEEAKAILKPGDRVTLKSGGPVMTIEDVFTDTFNEVKVSCSWFAGNQAKERMFAPEAIEKESK